MRNASAIGPFFQSARLFALRVSAFSWFPNHHFSPFTATWPFPNHCCLQSSLLILFTSPHIRQRRTALAFLLSFFLFLLDLGGTRSHGFFFVRRGTRAYTVALSCRPVLPPLKRAALLTPPRVAFSGGVFLKGGPDLQEGYAARLARSRCRHRERSGSCQRQRRYHCTRLIPYSRQGSTALMLSGAFTGIAPCARRCLAFQTRL